MQLTDQKCLIQTKPLLIFHNVIFKQNWFGPAIINLDSDLNLKHIEFNMVPSPKLICG